MAKQIQSMADALSIFMEQHPDIPECNPGTEIQQNPDNGNAQIRLDIIFERKGRAGKQATIVCGFPESYPLEKLQEIASKLKQKLGVGGSARGGEILFQGDQRKKLFDNLTLLGFKARII